MGWVQSPPTFSTMSETICDLANRYIRQHGLRVEPHRLEELAAPMDDLSASPTPRSRSEEDTLADLTLALGQTAPAPLDAQFELAPPSNRPLKRPLAHTDVFVDDFIQLCQGGQRRLKAIRQHLLHAVDAVLARPEVSAESRLEAISLKKLLKGDGSWGTRKIILGWLIDTVRQTIELPAHRKIELSQLFHELRGKQRVTRKRWEQILGKLRFVSVAIPGSAGLFCALQLALNKSSHGRVRLTTAIQHHLSTFARLAASLGSRPTYLAEIVPQDPNLLGATDAAKPGMGGVYFDATGAAYVWRQPFSPDIQRRLVSFDNPRGTITNSDLEQAGLLAQVHRLFR